MTPFRLLLTFLAILALGACGGSSSVTTTTASYALTATALNPGTVSAGNTATSVVTVTPANGYTGSVSLSCSMVSGGNPAPTCAFSMPTVPITGPQAANSTLIVTTSAATPGGTYNITVAAVDANHLAPENGPQTVNLINAAVLQHVVVIFQENRTPDNLFQDPVLISRGADIVNQGKTSTGQTLTLSPIDLGTAGANPQNYDLSHAHEAFVQMYDGGKMDGANLIACSPAANCPPNAHPNPQYMYVMPSDVHPYFAMAEQYTFGDRMFQTNEGPSFPAHQFILSGTSAPAPMSTLFAAENPNLSPAGCIAPLAEIVTMIDASGSETAQPGEYPCFDHPTLTDLLDDQGISWRYYAPSAGSIWTAPDAISHICQEQPVNGIMTCTGPDWVNNVVIPQSQVLVDIANQNLAQVVWVIPTGTNSDHAESNDGSGPSWVASIVNSIGNSPYWANTAIIITWDDWGGWFDHVAPKVVNDGVSWGSGYVYGFRVPLIIVSPYAKTAYISHVTHDFGSILKFIEGTFDLSSLGYADAPADDFSDCFVLTQAPNAFKTIPAPQDAAHFINDKTPPTDPDDE